MSRVSTIIRTEIRGCHAAGWDMARLCDVFRCTEADITEALKDTKQQLTVQERTIHDLVIAGKGRNEICGLLGIMPGTLDTHLSRIKAKGHALPVIPRANAAPPAPPPEAAKAEAPPEPPRDTRPIAEQLFEAAWCEHHGAGRRYQDDARQAAISRMREPVFVPPGTASMRTLGGVWSYA